MSITVDTFGTDGDRAGTETRRASAFVHVFGCTAVALLALGCGWSALSSRVDEETAAASGPAPRADREPPSQASVAKDSPWSFADRFAAVEDLRFSDRFAASAPSSVPSRVAAETSARAVVASVVGRKGADAGMADVEAAPTTADARVADARTADARTPDAKAPDNRTAAPTTPRQADVRIALRSETRPGAKPDAKPDVKPDARAGSKEATRGATVRVADAPSPAEGWSPAHKEPNVFERLFGKGRSSPLLAYASADASATDTTDTPSLAGGGETPALYDRQTAVYDITAKTVYLPNGTKLEAHSGLGEHMDKPESQKLRMRGVTPPHLYDLTLRESLFHGVQAIRLNPIGGEEKIHGRVGLLAHSYMLGGNGQSNGCVSFRNYDAFLKAFRDGQIKRLAVVAKL